MVQRHFPGGGGGVDFSGRYSYVIKLRFSRSKRRSSQERLSMLLPHDRFTYEAPADLEPQNGWYWASMCL